MLKLTSKIEIAGTRKWIIERIAYCRIDRDAESLTTTCEIHLPKKIRWRDEIGCPVKRGDTVKVWLGYNDDLKLCFTGYVIRVGLNTPIVLECEDEMFVLKNTLMDYSLLNNDIEINNFLKNFTDYPVRGVTFKINSYYRSSCETVAEFLQYIKSFGPDKFFFRDLEGRFSLVCLNTFTPNLSEVVDEYVFETGRNIINTNGLEIFKAEGNDVYVKISVPAVVNARRTYVERGTQNKAIKRFVYRKGLYDESIANRLADFIVKRETESGFKGSFTSFGKNLVWPFDIVCIKIDGNRMGKYQVQRNIITYGKEGFRQRITLGCNAETKE